MAEHPNAALIRKAIEAMSANDFAYLDSDDAWYPEKIEKQVDFMEAHPDIPVCIRINPHVMAGGNNNISVGHIDSKFGISIHQIPHLLRIVDLTGQRVHGIHMHTGSDILDIDVFLYASEILFETAKHFRDLDFIDFGSGFKVPYRDGDIETNVEELGQKLGGRFNEFG